MKLFSRLGFYIFHPISVPFLAALFYFIINPRFLPAYFIKEKLGVIALLSIVFPFLFVLALLKLKLSESIEFAELSAKRILLLCLAIILILLNKFVLQDNLPELLYFYTGFLLSICGFLFLSLFKINLSLHTAGVSAILGFIAGISLLYRINLVYFLGLSVFIIGWVGTARIYSTTHQFKEIVWAFILGIAPQIYFLSIAIQHYKM